MTERIVVTIGVVAVLLFLARTGVAKLEQVEESFLEEESRENE